MKYRRLQYVLKQFCVWLALLYGISGLLSAPAFGQYAVTLRNMLGEVRTTTEDYSAKYYLEHFTNGDRKQPRIDSFLERLECHSLDALCRVRSSSVSLDLQAAMVANRLEVKLRSENPLFAQSLEASLLSKQDSIDFSPQSLARIKRVIMVAGATRTQNKMICEETERFLAICNRSGIQVQVVETPEFPHVATAASLICRHIIKAETAGEPYTILCMSCGCPATLIAIDKICGNPSTPGYGMPACRGVISVSGIPNGTVLADQANAFPYRSLTILQFFRNGIDRDNVRSMSLSRLRGLHSRLSLPDTFPFIYYVPIPFASSVNKKIKKLYDHMGKDGLNDGLVHTRDAVVDHGIVVPVLGTDHSFSNHEHARLGVTAINALALYEEMRE